MATFELSRPTVGAMAVGVARAAYEYALDYAKERVVFGRPIIEEASHLVSPRRHRHRDRRSAAARRARGMDGRNRPEVRLRGGVNEQAEGRPGSGVDDERAIKSSAATVTPASIRSSGCTATLRACDELI